MLIWVILILTLVALLMGSIFFVQIHIDPSEKALLSKVIASLAMFFSFCAVFLLPIDVFSLTMELENTRHFVKILYYVLYCSLAVFAFLLMPFAYFFYEEEDGSNDVFPQAVRALKYTLGIFGTVLTISFLILVVNFRKLEVQSHADRMQSALSTVMSLMLGIGLMGYTTYTAFGLAWLPYRLFRSAKRSAWTSIQTPDSSSELLHIHAQVELLQARYISRPQHAWSQADKLEFDRLRQRESQVALACEQLSTSRRTVKFPCTGVWRKIAGFILACCSLLIVSSLLLSTVDKSMNSECGFACGYQSDQLLANPISILLVVTSSYFPLDLICFALLMLYLFSATLTGLVRMGVRILFIKLYSIRTRQTKQNALLMGVWLMVFLLLAINTQTLVLAPQYAIFGNQVVTESNGIRRPCQLNDAGEACVASVLYQINNSLFANVPLIGGLSFMSNAMLVLVFFCTFLWTSCIGRRPNLPYLRGFDDADDLGEYLVS